MDLDADPSTIESWEEYAKACQKENKMSVFKKKLSDYIWNLNMQESLKLQEYGVRRAGEIYRDEQEENFKRRRMKKEMEMQNKFKNMVDSQET